MKAEHRMDRDYLKGRDGDRANAVLAAAGYNFGLLLGWFEAPLCALIAALFRAGLTLPNRVKIRQRGFLTNDSKRLC
jgi:IS5 family transposase